MILNLTQPELMIILLSLNSMITRIHRITSINTIRNCKNILALFAFFLSFLTNAKLFRKPKKIANAKWVTNIKILKFFWSE